MCKTCAAKFSRDGSSEGAAVCTFAGFSIEDVKRKATMTQEEWDEEQWKKNSKPPEEPVNIWANLNEELKRSRREGYAVSCPRCGCTTINAEKAGFAVGKALGASMLFGKTAGYIAGATGSNKTQLTCLGCGYRWIIKR